MSPPVTWAGDYRLRRGDTLDLVIEGQPTLSGRLTVRDDGRIALPGVWEVISAEGVRPSELSARVTAALYPRYLRQPPTLTVRVVDSSSSVRVLGRVRQPGRIKLGTQALSLLDAIMEADRAPEEAGEETKLPPLTERGAIVLWPDRQTRRKYTGAELVTSPAGAMKVLPDMTIYVVTADDLADPQPWLRKLVQGE